MKMTEPTTTSHQRILIVDDSRAIHDDFRKILDPKGDELESDELEQAVFGPPDTKSGRRVFEIDSAFQGEEALLAVTRAAAERRPYALAFVDIRMPPGWDGIETIARIWAVDPDLQVVICSAYSDYSWDEMVETLGHTDRLVILKKPFDVVEVLQLANAFVAKWKLAQEVRFQVDELENRIAQRTHELQTANSALQAQIADRNQIEIQLRHAQKMESIGQLAAGIAHEINTPTQFIGDNIRFIRDAFAVLVPVFAAQTRLLDAARVGPVSALEIAEIEAAAKTAELDYTLAEIPRALSQSLEGIDRVSKIVGAMKEFSHPDSAEKTACDLNHAIENTLTVCRSEWKYVADLVRDLDPKLPLVPILLGEFNQVVLNIVINAAHAIADVKNEPAKRGTITIQTLRDGNWAEVRIGDTGTGIPESARLRVFDPFFTTKGVGRGTGQGLAIAHAVIVKKHGGTIRFETVMGQGTTFIVRLPLSQLANESQLS